MKIYFDGGASPNPGLGECGVISLDGSIRIHRMIPGQKTTNNEAEWLGFLLAVEYTLPFKEAPIEIVGDSKLVIMQAQGLYKVNAENLKKYRDEFFLIKDSFKSLKLTHVKRHLNLAGIYIEELQKKR